jgi:hypothetical protein
MPFLKWRNEQCDRDRNCTIAEVAIFAACDRQYVPCKQLSSACMVPADSASSRHLTTMQDNARSDCKTVGFQGFSLRLASEALLARGMQ